MPFGVLVMASVGLAEQLLITPLLLTLPASLEV